MLDQNDLKVLSELLEKQKNEIMAEVRQEIQQAKIESIQESAHNTKVLLESLITPRFNLLAEGQQTLLETLAPKSRVEDLEEDVSTLKGVVRNLSFDVSELKKAQ